MSLFQVQLVQGNQSDLDTAVVNGVSIQRSIWVAGPNRVPRELNDGATFVDCNYWLRYAQPIATADNAIINVLSNDGSVYVDGNPNSSNFVGGVFPKVYNLTVGAGSTYTAPANIINLIGDTGSFAVYTQITVSGASVTVEPNGNSGAIFTVTTSEVQIFNPGDLTVTSLAFANSNGSPATVQVLFAVQTVATS